MPPSAASAEAAGEGAVPPLLVLPPKIFRTSLPTLFRNPDRSQAAGEHNTTRPAKNATARIGSDLGVRQSGVCGSDNVGLRDSVSGSQSRLCVLLSLLLQSDRSKKVT